MKSNQLCNNRWWRKHSTSGKTRSSSQSSSSRKAAFSVAFAALLETGSDELVDVSDELAASAAADSAAV